MLVRDYEAYANEDLAEFAKQDTHFHHLLYLGMLNNRLANTVNALYAQINRVAI